MRIIETNAPAGVPLPFCLLGMIEPKAGPTAA
jgi:hypothetical protein